MFLTRRKITDFDPSNRTRGGSDNEYTRRVLCNYQEHIYILFSRKRMRYFLYRTKVSRVRIATSQKKNKKTKKIVRITHWKMS